MDQEKYKQRLGLFFRRGREPGSVNAGIQALGKSGYATKIELSNRLPAT